MGKGKAWLLIAAGTLTGFVAGAALGRYVWNVTTTPHATNSVALVGDPRGRLPLPRHRHPRCDDRGSRDAGQELTEKKDRTVQGVRFTTGSLKDRRVVLAHSGIGKVNAAMAATLLVEQFQPTHILFTGIAGGVNPDLRPGDVVMAPRPPTTTTESTPPKGSASARRWTH